MIVVIGHIMRYTLSLIKLKRRVGDMVSVKSWAGRNPAEYKAWRHMKGRCYCKTDGSYPRYGGRGITVCDEWLDSFPTFLMSVGIRPTQRHSLGRIDNEAGYSPENCQWETPTQQANNRRTSRLLEYKGVTKTAAEWTKELNMSGHTLLARIDRYGMTIAEAIETPVVTPNRSGLTYNGETLSVKAWARKLGFSKNTISERIKRGWSIEKALTTGIK